MSEILSGPVTVCKYSIIDSCRVVQQGSAHSFDLTRLQNLRTRPFATVAAADMLPGGRWHRSKFTSGLTVFKRNGVVTVLGLIRVRREEGA